MDRVHGYRHIYDRVGEGIHESGMREYEQEVEKAQHESVSMRTEKVICSCHTA